MNLGRWLRSVGEYTHKTHKPSKSWRIGNFKSNR